MYLDRTREILDGSWCEGRKFALTLALTTETPINRAFQTESEGVRVKKEKKFFYFRSRQDTRILSTRLLPEQELL